MRALPEGVCWVLSHSKNTGVVPATKTASHHMLKPRVYCTTKTLVCRRFQNCLLSKVTWGESSRKDFEPRAQSPAPLSTPGSLSCGTTQDLKQMGEGTAEPTSWENVGAHGSHGHTVLSAADPAMQEWLGAHLWTGVLGTSLPWKSCQEDEGSKWENSFHQRQRPPVG